MTDRELLEMAAKAAGISGAFENGVIWYKNEFGDDAGFNPLADDGAALRLAVAMKFDIITDVPRDESYAGTRNRSATAYVDHDEDPCAATRLAIVRAAAEIGRAMP